MRRAMREIGYAFLAWLLPFAVSVGLFPVKKSNPPLFESLIAVTLAASTVVLGCAYFRRVTDGFVRIGLRTGVLWMLANWLLDGLMFSGGPMKMSLSQYVADIGAAYVMIPVITAGLGYAIGARRSAASS